MKRVKQHDVGAHGMRPGSADVPTVGAIHELPLRNMNEQSQGLPEGWEWKCLGEALPIHYGKGLPAANRDQGGEVPVFGSSGKVGLHSKALTSKAALVIGRKGSVGEVHYSSVPCWPIDTTYYAEENPYSDLRYFYYLLKFLNLSSLDKSTAVPGLSRDDYNKVLVPLAPLPVQKLIVAEIEKQFSRLDEAVAALRRVQANLKRYKASVLKAAVEGRLTQEWRKHNAVTESGADLLKRILAERRKKWEDEQIAKMRKNAKNVGAIHELPLRDDIWKKKYKEPAAPDISNLPELPEGWVWATIDHITESMKNGIYKPADSYSEDGIACLRMYNIEQGKIVWRDIKRMTLTETELEEYGLLPGDILINRVNSRELVGKAAPIPTGLERCVFESKNIRLRLLTGLADTHYTSFQFSVYGRGYFNQNAQQVVGMASISQPQVAAFPIPLPPLSEQCAIVAEVDRRLSVAEEIEAVIETNLKRAERMRQAILKKAFTGGSRGSNY